MPDDHADNEQRARAAVIRATFAWPAAHRLLLAGTAVKQFQHEQRSADADRSLSQAVDELRAASDPAQHHPDPVIRRSL